MLKTETNGVLKVGLVGNGSIRILFFPRQTEEPLLVLSSALFEKIDNISAAIPFEGVENILPQVALVLNHLGDKYILGDKTLWQITKVLRGVFNKTVSLNKRNFY